MPIDINGYSDAFKAFTDFAAKNIEAGKPGRWRTRDEARARIVSA